METKKRLVEYLKTKGIGQTDFEEKSGLSRGQIAKKQGLTSPSLGKISNYFPELNMNWLLTGTGNKEITEVGVLQPDPDLIIALKETIVSQRLTIEAQREAIEAITKKTPVQNRKEVEMAEI
ncbi:hypothetical protein Barb6_00397 [Bacteroidales bacterium Barb6]|nr:hypothetical protein Barb6_00397 [Bacteroidales bacterium Barb6]